MPTFLRGYGPHRPQGLATNERARSGALDGGGPTACGYRWPQPGVRTAGCAKRGCNLGTRRYECCASHSLAHLRFSYSPTGCRTRDPPADTQHRHGHRAPQEPPDRHNRLPTAPRASSRSRGSETPTAENRPRPLHDFAQGTAPRCAVVGPFEDRRLPPCFSVTSAPLRDKGGGLSPPARQIMAAFVHPYPWATDVGSFQCSAQPRKGVSGGTRAMHQSRQLQRTRPSSTLPFPTRLLEGHFCASTPGSPRPTEICGMRPKAPNKTHSTPAHWL